MGHDPDGHGTGRGTEFEFITGDAKARPAMKRLLFVLIVFACTRALTAQTPAETDKPVFQPAQISSVGDIAVLSTSNASGTVVLEALISEEGKPQSVEVRREIPGLTELAVDAVKNWKFSPAKIGDKAVASRIAVAVTFCPAASFPDTVPLPALKPQSDAAIQAEFQPAEVLRGKFPINPVDATAFGAVVLEVSLNAKGEAGDVKVLQDLPPFTSHAEAVVGDWRFMAATDNGSSIPSKIVLAFVFRPLTPNNN
jgi:TonB family protein